MIHVGEIVSHMQMERHHVKDCKGVKLTCSHFCWFVFWHPVMGLFPGDVGGVHWWYHALQGPGTGHWPSRNACRTETIGCSSVNLFVVCFARIGDSVSDSFRKFLEVMYWQHQTNRVRARREFSWIFVGLAIFCFLNSVFAHGSTNVYETRKWFIFVGPVGCGKCLKLWVFEVKFVQLCPFEVKVTKLFRKLLKVSKVRFSRNHWSL